MKETAILNQVASVFTPMFLYFFSFMHNKIYYHPMVLLIQTYFEAYIFYTLLTHHTYAVEG